MAQVSEGIEPSIDLEGLAKPGSARREISSNENGPALLPPASAPNRIKRVKIRLMV